MKDLPADLQSDIEMLYLHLNVSVPNTFGSGVDEFVPLIEHIKNIGGVFLIKWDGERDSRQYTAVVSHPDTEVSRADDHTVELATARAIISFAKAMFDFTSGSE